MIIFLTIILLLGSTGAVNVVNAANTTVNSNNTGNNTNWTSNNCNPNMSRNSPQTTINKTNVNQLQQKWKFNTGSYVESPPLIVGKTCYLQNSFMQIFALDLLTGLLNGNMILRLIHLDRII